MTSRTARCELLLLLLLLLLLSVGCDGTSPRLATPVYLQPAVRDAGVEGGLVDNDTARPQTAPSPPLLPSWCGAERGALDATQKIGEITDAFVAAQRAECGALTRGLTLDELASWRAYLYNYTSVMAGCVDLVMPPPGGILAFGPGNTQAVGVTREPLSGGDADLLIRTYVSIFAPALSLSSEDRAAVEAHLRRTAEPEIDPSLADGLAVCSEIAAG